MLGAVQDAEDAADNVMLDGSVVSVPPDDVYEVIDRSGRVLGRTENGSGLAELFQQSRTRSESRREKGESAAAEDPNPSTFSKVEIGDKEYRVIRMEGLRIVDPGDANGGVRRYVTVYYGSSVKRVWGAVLRAAGFYALSSLLVLAATGVLMSWLLNQGLAPLRELAASAAKVSVASWAFSPPEDARRTKELAPLVVALEDLLGGLETAFAQQRRFVGDAAHELKTSVAVVKSSLQLLGLKQRSIEEYKAGLERCLTDCERIEVIVAQMLTLGRLEEAGLDQTVRFSTDLAASIQKVVEEFDTVAQAKSLHISPRYSGRLMVDIDPQQFELLCKNLLMNALEHSSPNKTVSVTLDHVDDLARMRVIDAGEGIDPQFLPHIFERFSRVDPSRSRKTGGSGLGLAICKAICDKYRGVIEIVSEPAKGTTVLVTFPLISQESVEDVASGTGLISESGLPSGGLKEAVE
jgi:signal transduction histidine kinase